MHQERQCFFPNEFSSTTDSLILPNYLNKLQNPRCDASWSEEVLQGLQGFGMAQQIPSYWKDTAETQELPVGISLNGHGKNSQQSDFTKLYISALRKKQTGSCKKVSPFLFKVKFVSVFHGRSKKNALNYLQMSVQLLSSEHIWMSPSLSITYRLWGLFLALCHQFSAVQLGNWWYQQSKCNWFQRGSPGHEGWPGSLWGSCTRQTLWYSGPFPGLFLGVPSHKKETIHSLVLQKKDYTHKQLMLPNLLHSA